MSSLVDAVVFLMGGFVVVTLRVWLRSAMERRRESEIEGGGWVGADDGANNWDPSYSCRGSWIYGSSKIDAVRNDLLKRRTGNKIK